jgi:hypothetical protein
MEGKYRYVTINRTFLSIRMIEPLPASVASARKALCSLMSTSQIEEEEAFYIFLRILHIT